jgi:Protein of unknown function (DUF2723)
MKNYQKINNVAGWFAFLIAAFVYLSTMEPTASFWDCGEYIATSFKLEVGHPPGAPLFNLIGRFFTLFTTDISQKAMMVNSMSALASAFTILFLFWSITAFAKKIALRTGELTQAKTMAIIGSGLVGALAYTFSDSFWFSAVEGEVYASSSFFTAIVFWAILKWESVADEPHSERWIVLIAYLMGLSIGVHLLNLLAIPAITFVYYYKKFTPSRKGFILTGILSVFLLVIIQNGIIPKVVSFSAKTELLFVNTFGLPFNSGTLFFFALLVGGIVWGLNYTSKKNKPVANTVILCFSVILIGYSSFFTLIIRSQANTPMDENNPENAVTLLAYLNREQYGDWPIGYGQYFNAPLDPANPYSDGNPVYTKDEAKGEYIVTDDRKSSVPNYDPAFCTPFPRMWSSQGNHISGYKDWTDFKGTPVRTTNNRGEAETIMKPTFGENMKYFFKYQIGHMFVRYFMWNFSGKQNDVQGHGSILKGNWISGIPFIDNGRIGSQTKVSESWKNNKARNTYYMLPFLLGCIGLIFHIQKDTKDALIVGLLFFFTGLAIVIYLNQSPYQPRERDYAYVGAFYAFAIWIGLGAYAIFDFLSKKISGQGAAVVATALGLLAAPVLMAKDGWDDHSRAHRYTARDFAFNYLNSCAPNAILFTNGDNDTFPLWYAQEVEGMRTDVRVVNLSLAQTDWYIDQMRRKAYDSDPVPMTLTANQVRQGTRDYVPIYKNPNMGIDTGKYYNIKDLIKFVASENPDDKVEMQSGQLFSYLPTNKIFIPVDSAQVMNDGVVPKELAAGVSKGITWNIKKNYILKNDLVIFDILATNNWKRPVYFAVTVGDDAYMNLEPYFQLEGLAYRVIPARFPQPMDGQSGRVNTDLMYKNIMEKFVWGGMDKSNIYMDENNIRMTMNLRNNFARLADQLMAEGKKDKAIKALDKCMEVMPEKIIPYNFFMMPVAEAYYKAGENEKANKLVKRLSEIYKGDLEYYFSLRPALSATIDQEKQQALSVLSRLMMMTKNYKQDALSKEIEKDFSTLQSKYGV